MIILSIDEEYGYNVWYAILSDERYEELKKEWQTIKGLNCLVPVRFLIPEAVNLPLLPEDQKYADEKYVADNNIRIESAHIHQSDDSYLSGVDYEIPDQDEFEFKGKRYSEEELNSIFREYKDADNNEINRREKETPELFEGGIYIPRAWRLQDGFGPIVEIYDWPVEVPLPAGWVRTHEGKIERE